MLRNGKINSINVAVCKKCRKRINYPGSVTQEEIIKDLTTKEKWLLVMGNWFCNKCSGVTK